MKEYLEEIIREIPNFPQPGILFKDISPLLSDVKAFSYIIDWFAETGIKGKVSGIAAIEARGFIFGSALAHHLKIPLGLIRKRGKLPGPVIRRSYDLEYGSNELEIHQDIFPPESRILLIDDVLASGGTAVAAALLLKELQCHVIESAFLIELKELNGKELLKSHSLPSHSLLQL
jgi:adenine phosphoribosyltransferase